MRVLVIDNYDSFTYNLVQYLGELEAEVLVRRNNEVSLEELLKLHPDRIVVSPGPCTPKEAGSSLEVVEEVPERVPVLGVCLGRQAVGQAYGGRVVRAEEPVHKTARILHDGEGAPTWYRSILVTSRTEDGVIMGVRHRERLVEDVQFYPESGRYLLKNFLEL
jgi:anthranilate synthase component 2